MGEFGEEIPNSLELELPLFWTRLSSMKENPSNTGASKMWVLCSAIQCLYNYNVYQNVICPKQAS